MPTNVRTIVSERAGDRRAAPGRRRSASSATSSPTREARSPRPPRSTSSTGSRSARSTTCSRSSASIGCPRCGDEHEPEPGEQRLGDADGQHAQRWRVMRAGDRTVGDAIDDLAEQQRAEQARRPTRRRARAASRSPACVAAGSARGPRPAPRGRRDRQRRSSEHDLAIAGVARAARRAWRRPPHGRARSDTTVSQTASSAGLVVTSSVVRPVGRRAAPPRRAPRSPRRARSSDRAGRARAPAAASARASAMRWRWPPESERPASVSRVSSPCGSAATTSWTAAATSARETAFGSPAAAAASRPRRGRARRGRAAAARLDRCRRAPPWIAATAGAPPRRRGATYRSDASARAATCTGVEQRRVEREWPTAPRDAVEHRSALRAPPRAPGRPAAPRPSAGSSTARPADLARRRRRGRGPASGPCGQPAQRSAPGPPGAAADDGGRPRSPATP